MQVLTQVPKSLSPREAEIVQLSVEGLTNDAIAYKLGLSVGTVNTYWMRIRSKVGGSGRTDTVAKIVASNARKSQRDASEDPVLQEATLALFRVAAVINECLAWAVGPDLVIRFAEKCDTFPEEKDRFQIGHSIEEAFAPTDPDGVAVKAHHRAVSGQETVVRIDGRFGPMTLRAIPLRNDRDEVLGCVGMLCAAN